MIDLEDGYEALLAGARPAEFPDSLAPDAIAGLFYTGGTTGAAKGVMLTHRNLIANAMHFQAAWPFGPDTRWLIIRAAVPRGRLDRGPGDDLARRPPGGAAGV